MHEHVTGLVPCDRRVATLVKTLVAVGCMAGRATDPSMVPSLRTPLDGMVTALALLADVGERRQRWIFIQPRQLGLSECLRKRFVLFDKNTGLQLLRASM